MNGWLTPCSKPESTTVYEGLLVTTQNKPKHKKSPNSKDREASQYDDFATQELGHSLKCLYLCALLQLQLPGWAIRPVILTREVTGGAPKTGTMILALRAPKMGPHFWKHPHWDPKKVPGPEKLNGPQKGSMVYMSQGQHSLKGDYVRSFLKGC